MHTEQAPLVLTEDLLCLHVYPTPIALRAQEMPQTGLSDSESHLLERDICMKISLLDCFLAFRAVSKD